MLQHYTEELEETFHELQTSVDKGDSTNMGRLLEDSQAIITSIELCRPSNASTIIPQYKQQHSIFKKKYEDLQHTSLIAGSTTSTSSASSQQRQQMDQNSKDNVQRLEKSSTQLKDALRVAKETEEMGRETMQTLQIQKEQMLAMTGKVEKINTTLGEASKELNAMERRQKIMKYATSTINSLASLSRLPLLRRH